MRERDLTMTTVRDADIYAPRIIDHAIDAVVQVPGSKSITNRALLVAALADGASELTGALCSDDTTYMAAALNELGVRVETDEANARFLVQGGGGTFTAPAADLFIGNSGTTARFLTAALPLGRGTYRLDGVPRMRQRPIGPLLRALRDLGADAVSELDTGCPPVVVRANGLPGGRVRMAGDESSQYFTALLLAGPYAERGIEIEVLGDLVSKPYLPMTAAVMTAFGVTAEIDEATWRTLAVRPGQHYTGRSYRIEPDASSASYFFAAAAVTGGRVLVKGIGANSTQGDLRFIDVLAAMGAEVREEHDAVEVIGPAEGRLRGGTFEMGHISDTAQTLGGDCAVRRRSGHDSRCGPQPAERDGPDRGDDDGAAPTGASRRGVPRRPNDHAAADHARRYFDLRRSPDRDELRHHRVAGARHPSA